MNSSGLIQWLATLDSGLLVCGQLHPEFHLPCEKALSHSTLGGSGRVRAHEATPPPGDPTRRYVWTVLADHKWRLDQKRRGRHPAGGDER